MSYARYLKASLAVIVAVAAGGCVEVEKTGGTFVDPNQPQKTSQFAESLEAFDDESTFEAYMADLEQSGSIGPGGPIAAEGAAANNGSVADSSGSAAPSEPSNENITNNQESGVDEGGIVKNVGDHLVVLRRGRLYASFAGEAGKAKQTDSIRVAPNQDLNQSVWYDEMLVKGDQIYVIGYRYLTEVKGQNGKPLNWIWGATEVSSFTLDRSGKLTRGETTFLESNDYYSSDNYASRMVDGKLVFYMPHYAFVHQSAGYQIHIPRILEHERDQAFRAKDELFEWKDVMRPVTKPDSPTFHTIVQCDLPDDGSFDCDAKSLLADWSREFYVSPEYVFLFTEGMLYAFSQRDLRAAAHAVRGMPFNQFAFKHRDDLLHVVVEDEHDTASNSSVRTLEMLSLPIENFDAKGEQDPAKIKAAELQRSKDWLWISAQRYVGDHYVGAFEDGSSSSGMKIVAHDLAGGTTEEFTASGYVNRIEAMPGVGALIASQNQSDLELETLLLGSNPSLVPATTLTDMAEGEHRSHGFFFKPDADGGMFGLPVLGNTNGHGWWGTGVSNIAFFDVAPDGSADMLGTVSSSSDAEGKCETSCIDWYGNTRPIFLGDQMYALMGSELVEIDSDASGIRELNRLLFSF